LGFVEALRVALGGETAERAGFVVQELRLPRVVGALLLGAMFGLAGTIMQDTLRNPMAGPEFLGVASGASLFVAFVALFPVGLAPVWHPLLALVAGVLCAGAILG
jgi:iron complex transport system permease protein